MKQLFNQLIIWMVYFFTPEDSRDESIRTFADNRINKAIACSKTVMWFVIAVVLSSMIAQLK